MTVSRQTGPLHLLDTVLRPVMLFQCCFVTLRVHDHPRFHITGQKLFHITCETVKGIIKSSPEPPSRFMVSSKWVKHQFWVNYPLKVQVIQCCFGRRKVLRDTWLDWDVPALPQSLWKGLRWETTPLIPSICRYRELSVIFGDIRSLCRLPSCSWCPTAASSWRRPWSARPTCGWTKSTCASAWWAGTSCSPAPPRSTPRRRRNLSVNTRPEEHWQVWRSNIFSTGPLSVGGVRGGLGSGTGLFFFLFFFFF